MQLQISQIKALTGLLLFVAGLLYLVFVQPITFFPAPASAEIQSLFVTANKASIPTELHSATWHTQDLPDAWFQSKKTAQQYWYRYDFELEQHPENTVAVYLPMVSHNAAVFINNIWIGQSGKFTLPVARNHHSPLLFAFSPALLKTGVNQIHIRLKAEFHAQGLLDTIYYGDHQQLLKAYNNKLLLRVSFVKWLTGMMLVVAAGLAGIWFYRKHDLSYGCFSLLLLFWSLHNFNLFVVNIPLSGKTWETFTILTLGWTVTMSLIFNHKYLNKHRPRIEAALLAHSAFGLLLFLTPDYNNLLFFGYTIWYGFLIIFGAYGTHFLLSVFIRENNKDALIMLFAGSMTLLFGLHDILLANHYWSPFDGFIIQYSALLTVAVISGFLFRRFINSLETAEQLTLNLELRVEQNQKKLEAQYQTLYQLQKERVLSEERERMMRDMHDGFGGQLVSLATLFQQQSGEIFKKSLEKIQHCMTDLHLVVDSLDPMLSDLPTLLGTIRLRLEDQLTSAKISLIWKVTELPELKDISPNRSLHIMRIIQEAITNCIKYAAAPSITVATGTINDKFIYIDIIDNGKGFDNHKNQTIKPGRGITNMHYRAQQLGGQLELESSSKGTHIRLLLPHTNVYS